jgi:cellulose synthase/poly-beta-1,6-N-acetylglucosamine synthase-like glycosyltransferase
MQDIPRLAFTVALELILIALLAGMVASLAVMLKGFEVMRRNRLRGLSRDDAAILLKSPLAPPVAVIAIPPDASEESRRYVHNLVKLHYGSHEVLLVLDGPTDEELAVWVAEFHLFPSSRASFGDIQTSPVLGVYESRDPIHLMVIEKEKGGTADSLNVGLNLAAAPLVALADPSTDVTPFALLRLVRPFLEDPDLTVGACAIAPPVEMASAVERFHSLGCLRAWFGRRAGLSSWNALLPAPGAFLLVRRQDVVEASGFYSSAFEIFVHLHSRFRSLGRPYSVHMVQEAVAIQRPPRSWGELRQRILGVQKDTLRAVVRHRAVLFGYGALGWIALPGLVWSGVLRPLLETIAWLLAAAGVPLGWVSWPLATLLVLCTTVTGTLNSMAAVVLRELIVEKPSAPAQMTAHFLAAIPENFGFGLWRDLWLLGGLFALGDGAPKARSHVMPVGSPVVRSTQ